MVMMSIYFEIEKSKQFVFSTFRKVFGKELVLYDSEANTLWFDDFYVKYLGDILEIVFINESISCDEVIKKIYKKVFGGEEIMVKIRNGNIEYYFWINKLLQRIGV